MKANLTISVYGGVVQDVAIDDPDVAERLQVRLMDHDEEQVGGIVERVDYPLTVERRSLEIQFVRRVHRIAEPEAGGMALFERFGSLPACIGLAAPDVGVAELDDGRLVWITWGRNLDLDGGTARQLLAQTTFDLAVHSTYRRGEPRDIAEVILPDDLVAKLLPAIDHTPRDWKGGRAERKLRAMGLLDTMV
jgi:hypothetical protein